VLWVLVTIGTANCVFAYWYMLRNRSYTNSKNVVVVETSTRSQRGRNYTTSINDDPIELEHLLLEPQEEGFAV